MAFAIADNQLATLSKWNDPVLADQLKALSVATVDLDVEATGFSLAEIELRIQPVNLDDDQSDPADKIPLPLDGPLVTQPGDLWILGRHRLLCGSALDPDTYATVMNGDVADLVFTDPLNDAQIDGNAAGLRRREFAIALHEMSSEQIEDFLNWVNHFLVRNSRDGSIHYIATDWHHVQELLVAGTSIYQKLLDFCVWTKANAGRKFCTGAGTNSSPCSRRGRPTTAIKLAGSADIAAMSGAIRALTPSGVGRMRRGITPR